MAVPTASTSAAPDVKMLPSYVALTPGLMNAFKPSRVFRNHNELNKAYTSLAFDDKGDWLVTAAEDETMQLFDVRKGKHQKQLYSKKYGVHLARFTHKNTTIIYASTKEDDTIRYLSLHDNTYLRYFKGHKKKVVSLEMSPMDDTFLSGATDDTVRLWDLRAGQAQGLLNVASHPCVAYDPSGAVFAVLLNLRSTLLLYDLKNFDKQPFLSVALTDPVLVQRSFPPRVPVFTSLRFSNDGKWLAVGTSGDTHYVVDAFDGGIVARLETPNGVSGLERAPIKPYDRPLEPAVGISSEELTWTPDGRYIITGSVDGKLHMYDFAPPHPPPPDRPPPGPSCTLHPFRTVDAHLGGPSRVVRFNPRSAMLASAGNDLAFWLPDTKEEGFPSVESS